MVQAYLVADAAVANVVTGVNLANVDDNAHKVVCTRPRQLVSFFRIRVPRTVCVRQHIQLQRELDLGVNLRSGLVPGPVSEFEPLQLVSKLAGLRLM